MPIPLWHKITCLTGELTAAPPAVRLAELKWRSSAMTDQVNETFAYTSGVYGATSNPVFDRLFEHSAAQILEGSHEREHPPVEGGRWPVSVVAAGVPQSFLEQLQGLLAEIADFAGPGHFMTGFRDSAHITVRALEPYREAAAREDPIVSDWVGAIKRAAADTRPFTLSCTGLTLSQGGVLAQLEPHDATPWELLDRLRAELGDLAWFEDRGMKRNILYASIIHFAGDVRDPRGLVDWVVTHRLFEEPTSFQITGLDLVRFHHTSQTATGAQYMRLDRWHSIELLGRHPT